MEAILDWFKPSGYESDGEEVVDADADSLSYVGQAAYEVLRTKHNKYHHELWNVTDGKVIDEVQYTPKGVFTTEDDDEATATDPPEGHDDWFPDRMYDTIIKTERWCDIMSLSEPDGLFMTKFKEALLVLAEKAQERDDPSQKITIRMMFGFVGKPCNCSAVIKELTSDLPEINEETGNIELWVGTWRKGVSWNHAKIIAVDGQYLITGGHNLWEEHYLMKDPVHDLSVELEGQVAIDAHKYANQQWEFVKTTQSSFLGQLIDDWIPDGLPMLVPARVIVSEYPEGLVDTFPPRYRKVEMPGYDPLEDTVPIISMGRYGDILDVDRPSDDAIVSMIDSAETIIRLALQDLGPMCIPGTSIPLPGCVWPKAVLSALGRAIWTKGVDVEILLSNPGSTPNSLPPAEASYGYGWSCVDVAAELIKTIPEQFPESTESDDDSALREKVEQNLRLCFIKTKQGNKYEGGESIGLHSKHFIIDDITCYIGSQNLYICDLAEWGIVVDNADATAKIMAEYWNPMWELSYTGDECDVQEVMDGLGVDRNGIDPEDADDETKKIMEEALCRSHGKYVSPTD